MFARGSRFPAAKPSDVPGPGHYNVQEAEDSYKHGAFLEKADRFDKDKESDIPGPGTHITERPKSRAQKAAPTASNDRYGALQKKLEDLERVHTEGKKENRVEQERLRRELSAAQRTGADNTEELTKTRQKLDSKDAHIRELNKAKAVSDTELKALRTKLRLAEQERDVDTKRRDDAREKDRRIAELERTVQTEQRRREAAETRVGMLQEAVEEAGRVQYELESVRDADADVLEQLQDFKAMLGAAAAQYGRLASTSVPTTEHATLKSAHAALQLRHARLERKLANTEDQVQELAHLVRQTKERARLLSTQLADADAHANSSSQFLRDVLANDETALALDTAYVLHDLGDEMHHAQIERHTLDTELASGQSDLWKRQARDLLDAFASAHENGMELGAALKGREVALSDANAARVTLTAELDVVRDSLREAERLHAKADITAQAARKAEADALKEVEDMKQISVKREAIHEAALQKEKEVAHRSAAVLRQSKLAEEALQTEIEQLTTELMDAIKYQHAYDQLTEQVSDAIARSALAEEEADKLSKFNAEILGHQNASQKIMYIDRVRRELAETKQQLLAMTRENDTVANDNQDLRYELDMYKSVADNRPRTGFTRVTRAPLAVQSINSKPSGVKPGTKSNLENVQEVDARPGDLTILDLA